MEGAVKKDFKLIVDNEGLESMSPEDRASAAKEELQRWPLFGLSVGSFLQVINMEQQTCLLEVYRSANQLGHFCIVEGLLYDAICGDREGEDAAMEMISWENVRLNIKQILSTKGLERKIEKNLMLLLMDGSRRRDEAEENIRKQKIIEEKKAEENIRKQEIIEEKKAEENIRKQKIIEENKAKEAELLLHDVERSKLDTCLKILNKDMGDALISGSIISIRSSKVLASYNIKPEGAALFKRLTDYFRNAFASGLSATSLGDHYILDLKGKQTLVVIILGEYQWSIVFNNVKCSLGLFQNIIMPKVLNTFNEMNL